MNDSLPSARDDAAREALIAYVATTSRRRGPALWGVALVLAGALAGAGASTAAFAFTGGLAPQLLTPGPPSGAPRPDLDEPVAAPPGTQPGAPIVSAVGTPATRVVGEPVEISLMPRPDAATHVRVTVTPLEPGGVTWGTDDRGNNPSSSWNADDIASGRASTWFDFALDDSTDVLHVTPQPGFSATISTQYLVYVPTHLAVNARGETYGVEGGPDGTPDLVAVVGKAPDGRTVEGYVRARDLHAFSPQHPEQPTNPDHVLEWQEERDQDYPQGWDVPVFESDGVTQIGVFRIGG